MATLKEQFEKSREIRDFAKSALDDINAQLNAIAEYRRLSEIQRHIKDTLAAEKDVFRQAGMLKSDGSNFSDLRDNWGQYVPAFSEAWHKIDAMEGRMQKHQHDLSTIKMRSFHDLLTERTKRRIVLQECETKFRQMRDLFYRDKQARQKAKPATAVSNGQAEPTFHDFSPEQKAKAVADTIKGTEHLLQRRHSWGDSRTRKGPRSKDAAKGKPRNEKKEKGTKAERKSKVMQESQAQG